MFSYLISDIVVLNSDNLLANCSTLDKMMCFGFNAPVDSTVKILSSSGILVALSIFFLKGVEEVPYPEGAVVFHAEGIALAFFLLFLCSIPIVLKSLTKKSTVLKNSVEVASNDSTKSNQSEDWEEATIEDLESGEFETL